VKETHPAVSKHSKNPLLFNERNYNFLWEYAKSESSVTDISGWRRAVIAQSV
jgi:hypothetical protein